LTFSTNEVVDDMTAAIALVRRANDGARVILIMPDRLFRADASAARTVRAAIAALASMPSVFAHEGDASDELGGLLEPDNDVPVRKTPPPVSEHAAFRDSVDTVVRALCDEHIRPDTVKCLVWDLDDTVWAGTLLEGDPVTVRDGVRNVIETLDRRGIVHSIASRADRVAALAKLHQLQLSEWFLHPQIARCSKAESIQRFADRLNLPLSAIAFIDDQASNATKSHTCCLTFCASMP